MNERQKNTTVMFAMAFVAILIFGYLISRVGHSTADTVEQVKTESIEQAAARRFRR